MEGTKSCGGGGFNIFLISPNMISNKTVRYSYLIRA